MVRITKEPDGTFRLAVTAEDIETPWNRCPQVYYAISDWLENYGFGKSTGKVIWENQPDNRQRSWWQISHALSVIKELCKNQDPNFMEEKLDKFKEQLESDMRHPDDRQSIIDLTEKDRSAFGTFNLMSELHVEPLFDGVEHEPTRTALRECMAWTKAIGTVKKPEEMLPYWRRCRTAVNKVRRDAKRG